MRRVPSPYGTIPDSYGIFFATVSFFGPNNVPKPIATRAISVASATITAIATYSSILTSRKTPRNRRSHLCILAQRSTKYNIRGMKVPLFTKLMNFVILEQMLYWKRTEGKYREQTLRYFTHVSRSFCRELHTCLTYSVVNGYCYKNCRAACNPISNPYSNIHFHTSDSRTPSCF